MGGPHSKITGLGIDPTTSHLWVTKPTIAPSPLIMSLIILSIKMETNLVFSYQTTLTRIQCLWKGALVRKRVKRQRQDELVFIGMVGTPKLFSIKWLIYTFLSIEHQYDNLTVQPGGERRHRSAQHTFWKKSIWFFSAATSGISSRVPGQVEAGFKMIYHYSHLSCIKPDLVELEFVKSLMVQQTKPSD